jgi:hypothetical protein
MQNGNALSQAANQFNQALGALALLDLERAMQDIERIQRPEIRAAAFLAVAQQFLNPPPVRRPS